ncbi:MAG: aconitate hydratase AcnA [Chloroflexi bacterium]|nr:aconitate hydratase AcnA [Chloroflexota bacterium]
MTNKTNPFGARGLLQTARGPLSYYDLTRLEKDGLVKQASLPFSIRILLESVLRNIDGYLVREEDVHTVARWNPTTPPRREIPFMPGRVLMQDFTGVPAVVDLAAMRSALFRTGGDPNQINPVVPADLVIDHSVQVDYFGSAGAFALNVEREFERNRERYALLRWAQRAFRNLRVVPPGTGICHQVNLEYLANIVTTRDGKDGGTAFPDTLVGTDSHTTMVNGLGVLGWGVGGIEAEAVLLGQPYYMLLPAVVGFKLTGALQEGTTATDLVLTVTQMLRNKGVVDKFVEFYGPGLTYLPLADRATIANMAPEYGATVGFFPVDEETLHYMRGTGRPPTLVSLVEQYAKAQGLFRTDATPDPQYSDTLALDMAKVEPSMAGPRRPQDRVSLSQMKNAFHLSLAKDYKKEILPGQAAASSSGKGKVSVRQNGHEFNLDHGAVVIAAITSCTNTSNPSVMIGAGLLAKKALERGVKTKPWVKTSMAPGSRVVKDYLEMSGLLPYLEAQGFHIVGFGCTTCIGNSGPLSEAISQAINAEDIVAAAVLSGNRNFEGRIHSEVKANYLTSPMLVVAYALTGSVDIDILKDPLGRDARGESVYLRDIWPSQDEIRKTIERSLNPAIFQERYAEVFEGDDQWSSLPVPEGDLFAWDSASTYVQEVPFFKDISTRVPKKQDIKEARVLVMLGDSITTDHISPAGSIAPQGPAGQFLIQKGVQPRDFNTYGARRGNHDVMVRGTFGNIRLKNKLVPDSEGDWTLYMPSGEKMRIYDASIRYQGEGVPLIVIAGKEYGSGSSRDWAAKGPQLLGVQAVIAEGYERIHRSNLVGMGVLPLQFKAGENPQSLGLTGFETYNVVGIAEGLKPGQEVRVHARRDDGRESTFRVICRIDTPVEIDYYRNGGVLQTVLRRMLK